MSAKLRPVFESFALDALAEAFHRRGKAIRSHGDFSITRKMDAGDERLEVDFAGMVGPGLRFIAWSAGEWWFLVCQPGPKRSGGWLFKHELRGTLVDRAADAIVKSFETSMLVGYESPQEQLATLQAIWHVRGPQTDA